MTLFPRKTGSMDPGSRNPWNKYWPPTKQELLDSLCHQHGRCLPVDEACCNCEDSSAPPPLMRGEEQLRVRCLMIR